MESKTLVDDTNDSSYDFNIYDDHFRHIITARTIYIYFILSKFLTEKLIDTIN